MVSDSVFLSSHKYLQPRHFLWPSGLESTSARIKNWHNWQLHMRMVEPTVNLQGVSLFGSKSKQTRAFNLEAADFLEPVMAYFKQKCPEAYEMLYLQLSEDDERSANQKADKCGVGVHKFRITCRNAQKMIEIYLREYEAGKML